MTKTSPEIFNRATYLARQSKTRASLTTLAMLDDVAEGVSFRLGVVNHQFAETGVIASVPAPIATALAASGKCAKITAIEPPQGDDLGLNPNSYDALFSILDLHCVNDVPGYIAQCARALRPDGLFMCCFFAGDTLVELRGAWLAAEADYGGVSPRVAPMVGLRELGGLLQRAGLALPVADSDRLTIRYANVTTLLRDIQAIGYANPLAERSKNLSSQRLLKGLTLHYPIDPDGRISATLEVIWGLAWKPHESQPQAKKPGSATARLADVLKQLDENS